ncbi:MAG: aspartate kinase [Candidatus Kapaibacterium sp.]
MKVMKFGGTSVGTAEAMRLVAGAITKQSGNMIVVLSASSGVTDKLVNITNSLPEDITSARSIYIEVEAQMLKIASDLELSESSIIKVTALLHELSQLIYSVELLEFISDNVANRIVAYGELLSTTIFSEYFSNSYSCKFLNITDYLTYDKKADQYTLANKEEIGRLLFSHNTIVTQGFICKNTDGNISNLGRGGSDYSAAIIAAEMQAKELQIWTDVNGVMSADPRIIKNPLTKNRINVGSLERMAFFGAKVIHPDTLKPTLMANIPVKILNTFNSDNHGTLVTIDRDNPIPTFTIKRKCLLYTFRTSSKKNLYQVNKYVTNMIIKKSLNLLSSVHIDNAVHYVLERSIDKFLDSDMNYESKKIDLIYICELNNSKINAILTNLNNLNIQHLEVDWASGAILILANADNKTEDYDRFHDMLINVVD